MLLFLFDSLFSQAIFVHEEKNIYCLNGIWEFSTNDSFDNTNKVLDRNGSRWFDYEIPGLWNLQGFNFTGSAWFRKEIILSGSIAGSNLGIMVPPIVAAYELYVNGNLTGVRGKISPDGKLLEENSRIDLFSIPAKSLLTGTNTIVFRVSSLSSDGGFLYPDFYIGEYRNVENQFHLYLIRYSGIIGIYLIVGLFYSILFLSYRKEKQYLYFGIVSLLLGIIFIGYKSIGYWIFDNAYFNIFLVYIGLALIPVFMDQCLMSVFKIKTSIFAKILYFILLSSIPLCILCPFSIPIYQFYFDIVVLVIYLTGILFTVYWMFLSIRAFKMNIAGAKILGAGVMLFLITAAIDLLSVLNVIKLISFSAEGYLIFIIFTAISLAVNYSGLNKDLIEERKKLVHEVVSRTAELAAANEKLQYLDRAKTQFLANVSHELRTPLTLILGPLELLTKKDYGDKISFDDRHFHIMLQNSYRLLRLVNNLLDFSKIEAGQMKPYRRNVNLTDILLYFVESAKTGSDSSGLDLSFEDRTGGIIVAIDRDLIEKAVFNLISNAMKFTPKGGFIRVVLEKDSSNFFIRVIDSGIGIPADKQTEIFERFFQVDGSESRQYEGTGIGLSLTKEIVELHGGSINVKSTPGYGSEFIIKMPLSKEQDQTESPGYQYDEIRELKNYMLSDFHGEDNRPAVPAGENPEKPLILFADDNSAMRDFIGEILGKEFRVITAVNGEDGLIRARETRPDLIISDLMMPVMDGYAFITELKKDRYMSSVPVILLTARAEMESKIEGLSIGADDYIHKPFDHAELIVRVRNLLSSRRAARELIDKQREIDSDFKQAALVQRTILTPKNLYDSIKGLEIDVRYIPMNGSISGDYYNISPLKNGIASVMIADASGHGVQAALSTMQLDLLNRDSLAESYPDKRMEHINRELVERLSSKNFFTGFLTHIHDDRVYYSSAAHPAQYLIRPADAEIIPLKTKGRIIGMLDSAVYDMKEEKAGKGDGLILFTDGIFEEFNNKGEEWGENYLKEFLSNNLARLAGSPVQDWGLMILAEMNSFRGDARINDDITIICLKWI